MFWATRNGSERSAKECKKEAERAEPVLYGRIQAHKKKKNERVPHGTLSHLLSK